MNYIPEKYWSKVAQEIAKRNNGNVIAGDDEPYYEYKRQQFLKVFNQINFRGKSVLELGSGPGGNLREVLRHLPARLVGVDLSENMLQLAAQNVNNNTVELIKTDGTGIPLPDNAMDIVYSVTVLQHNTDYNMFRLYLEEMGRVAREKVILFERTEATEKGDELNIGRPISTYVEILKNKGFELVATQYLPIHVSYYVCGAIRKLFNPANRIEGEPLSKLSLFLEKATLPITRLMDPFFILKKEVTKMEFQKINQAPVAGY
ncbi:class I SAM-dependent methyltransferase [Adhaeribacter swui]|uniref:Class I SAM-dependent methyltransferase n=1 Tax=Adhaeribacter swui TaxID=2086471 RepID=A0A7G7GBW9_9BACT|nr:class I SAM-dependent methyltransferase [Adhaeribacter swui]QNF34653.1 class I SAM-dependent methyltransferase [Adhaeribacter swui]